MKFFQNGVKLFLLALICCGAAHGAEREIPGGQVVQLPLDSESIFKCQVFHQTSDECANRLHFYELGQITGKLRKALDNYYSNDPSSALYFVLPNTGRIKVLLEYGDSVSHTYTLLTIRDDKVVAARRIGNSGPDELRTLSFKIEADYKVSVYERVSTISANMMSEDTILEDVMPEPRLMERFQIGLDGKMFPIQ